MLRTARTRFRCSMKESRFCLSSSRTNRTSSRRKGETSIRLLSCNVITPRKREFSRSARGRQRVLIPAQIGCRRNLLASGRGSKVTGSAPVGGLLGRPKADGFSYWVCSRRGARCLPAFPTSSKWSDLDGSLHHSAAPDTESNRPRRLTRLSEKSRCESFSRSPSPRS
jgi:hypothetical protein